MNIVIKSLRFDADKKLLDFIQKKLSKLSKLWDIASQIDVTLKVENDASDANKIVEAKVTVPGFPDIFASKQAYTFEEAIDGLDDVLSRLMVKAKEKAYKI